MPFFRMPWERASSRKPFKRKTFAGRRVLFAEPLEPRILLTVTPSLVPGGASFLGDGAADTLLLRVNVSNQLEYSTDGVNYSNNLGGGQLVITSGVAVGVDLGGGANTLAVSTSLTTALQSAGGTVTYTGDGGTDTLVGPD